MLIIIVNTSNKSTVIKDKRLKVNICNDILLTIYFLSHLLKKESQLKSIKLIFIFYVFFHIILAWNNFSYEKWFKSDKKYIIKI